jgi:hypothetical protein
MDGRIQSDESVSTGLVTVTVQKVMDEEANQTLRPSRPSFRSRMTDPVSHFRKRKWAPSRHSSPPAKRTDIVCIDDDSSAITDILDGSSSQDQDRRRHSSATDRFVGTLKKLSRKDSHQLESSVQVRRHVSPDQDEYSQVAAKGQLKLSNVSEYFNRMGESGPSNYYETDRWAIFQSPKEPTSKGRDGSLSPDGRSSIVRTPASPKSSETRATVVNVSPKPQKSSQWDALPALGSPESRLWRRDIFCRKPRNLSRHALGKQSELVPGPAQLHTKVRPAKMTGETTTAHDFTHGIRCTETET